MSSYTNRQAHIKWDEYIKNLRRETPVPVETVDVREKRKAKLLKNFPEFCQYYFPNYCSAPFAKFHLDAQKKVAESHTIYMCLAFAREHAKSVLSGLFIPLFEMFNGRMENMLLVSHNESNAIDLLMPIMLNLENNQRIIADFGPQKGFRGWETGNFVTLDGKSFRAIGSGQSPRGTRNEEKRPDFILVDDIDTDEQCRSEEQLKKKWAWVEKALFPCMSITARKRFIVVGNVLSGNLDSKEEKAKDSIVVRASRRADYFKRVDILDKHGKPSWSERYTLEQVNYMLSKISYSAGQSEYFNNPITEGTVFKDIRWGKVPPLSRFRLLVGYMDASYKSTASKKGDFKALVLLGMYEGKLYAIKARVERSSLATAIGWFYEMKDVVGEKSALYFFVEVNGLQDTWYEDVFLPACKVVEKQKGYHVGISADKRSKPDKFSRIEAALEPLNRLGNLIFNEDEIGCPHMQRLKEQFEAIEPSLSAHDDGPDATEGGYWILNNKLRLLAPIATGTSSRSKKKRF